MTTEELTKELKKLAEKCQPYVMITHPKNADLCQGVPPNVEVIYSPLSPEDTAYIMERKQFDVIETKLHEQEDKYIGGHAFFDENEGYQKSNYCQHCGAQMTNADENREGGDV